MAEFILPEPAESKQGSFVLPDPVKMPPLNWMDQHIEDEKNLKKVAAEVVGDATKGADTSGSTLTMKKELTKAMDMKGVETVDYLVGEVKQTGLFRNGILLDETGKEKDFGKEEQAELVMEQFADASNWADSPDNMDTFAVGSANGKWYVIRNPESLNTQVPKNIGGKNGFGSFAQEDERIPIPQMDASVKAYLNQKYTKDEWVELTPTMRKNEIKLAKFKIRSGEVLLVPNTSTEQLNAATATSNQLQHEKANAGGLVNVMNTKGDNTVVNQNTFPQANIKSTNEEWTQKAAIANALRFSGLSFPTN